MKLILFLLMNATILLANGQGINNMWSDEFNSFTGHHFSVGYINSVLLNNKKIGESLHLEYSGEGPIQKRTSITGGVSFNLNTIGRQFEFAYKVLAFGNGPPIPETIQLVWAIKDIWL
jgi:hypothetical protein